LVGCAISQYFGNTDNGGDVFLYVSIQQKYSNENIFILSAFGYRLLIYSFKDIILYIFTNLKMST
jgi:hypothetical protein